jgi:hypothetical protein
MVVDQKKIAIFHNLLPINNWEIIYDEQFSKILHSGLYEACELIHIGINSTDKINLPYELDKNKVTYNTIHQDEFDTLTSLYNFAKENPGYLIFYFYNKGVTHANEDYYKHVNSWRLYLEYFNVLKWQENVKLLEEYECVGTEYLDSKTWEKMGIDFELSDYYEDTNISLFAGNFWWTTSEYISRLDPDYLNRNLKHHRLLGETWLHTKDPKFYNHHKCYVGNDGQLSWIPITKYNWYRVTNNPLTYVKSSNDNRN